MQDNPHTTTFYFDDETCILSYDWTPSYKKLSSAVYHVANLNDSAEEKMSYRQMIEQVMEYYPKHVSFNQATKTKTQKTTVRVTVDKVKKKTPLSEGFFIVLYNKKKGD